MDHTRPRLPDEMVDACLAYLPLLDRVNISRRHRKKSKELASAVVQSAVSGWRRWLQTCSACCGVSPAGLNTMSIGGHTAHAGDIGRGWCVECVKRFYPIAWRQDVQTALTQAIVTYRMEPMIHATNILRGSLRLDNPHGIMHECALSQWMHSASPCNWDIVREFVCEFFERDGLDASAAARLQIACRQLHADHGLYEPHKCLAVEDQFIDMIRSKILSIASKWQWSDLITFATTTSRFHSQHATDTADAIIELAAGTAGVS